MSPVHRERVVTPRESGGPEEAQPESPPPPASARVGPAGEPWPERAPLLTPAEAQELTDRWVALQAGFIEEPEGAAEQADELVSEAIQAVVQAFTDERESIRHNVERERQEGVPDERSTEELRLALRRYRALLGRLLAL